MRLKFSVFSKFQTLKFFKNSIISNIHKIYTNPNQNVTKSFSNDLYSPAPFLPDTVRQTKQEPLCQNISTRLFDKLAPNNNPKKIQNIRRDRPVNFTLFGQLTNLHFLLVGKRSRQSAILVCTFPNQFAHFLTLLWIRQFKECYIFWSGQISIKMKKFVL